MIDGISCQLDFDYHQIKQDVSWSIVNENGLIIWKNKIIWRLPKNKVITLTDIEAKLNQKERYKKPLSNIITTTINTQSRKNHTKPQSCLSTH